MKSLITKKDLNFTDCKVFDVKNFRNYVIFSLVSLTLRLLVVKSRMSSMWQVCAWRSSVEYTEGTQNLFWWHTRDCVTWDSGSQMRDKYNYRMGNPMARFLNMSMNFEFHKKIEFVDQLSDYRLSIPWHEFMC